nr:SRPBCC family protein [Rhodococcus wratislaviensis]
MGPAVTKVHRHGSPGRGVGTIRDVTILGNMTVREHFYRWDELQRITFTATAITQPLCRRFAEDYRVEDTLDGSRLTWTAAMEPRLPPATHELVSAALRTSIAHLTKGLIRQTGFPRPPVGRTD